MAASSITLTGIPTIWPAWRGWGRRGANLPHQVAGQHRHRHRAAGQVPAHVLGGPSADTGFPGSVIDEAAAPDGRGKAVDAERGIIEPERRRHHAQDQVCCRMPRGQDCPPGRRLQPVARAAHAPGAPRGRPACPAPNRCVSCRQPMSAAQVAGGEGTMSMPATRATPFKLFANLCVFTCCPQHLLPSALRSSSGRFALLLSVLLLAPLLELFLGLGRRFSGYALYFVRHNNHLSRDSPFGFCLPLYSVFFPSVRNSCFGSRMYARESANGRTACRRAEWGGEKSQEGETGQSPRPARLQVGRRGGADTDNWEDASVLIATSRNWVEPLNPQRTLSLRRGSFSNSLN